MYAVTGITGKVGSTVALNDFQAAEGGEALRDMADNMINRQFLESARGDDFVGVQTYTRAVFGPHGIVPPSETTERTQMGYEFWPEALEATAK